MSVGNVSIRVPNPGTVQDRNVMAVRQPGFLDAYRTGVAAARAACCASGDGNTSHPAVQHYCRFMALGLNTSISRVLDPLSTPLERKLALKAYEPRFGARYARLPCYEQNGCT